MKPKVIKNEQEYDETLKYVENLMECDELNSTQVDELELLGTLIELYENEHYPMELPTPIEAIRFRMEQEGLTQSDLIPYLGSRSKVSEVLSGKRNLSLSMIRQLNIGLGIPAEVLLAKKGAELPPKADIDWLSFPINEMLKRGWFEGFSGTLSQAKERAEELIAKLAERAGMDMLQPTLLRQSALCDDKSDKYALVAWKMRICSLAKKNKINTFDFRTINEDFAKELTKLSYLDNGPLLAKEFLGKNGIHLITEKHLPKTYLDGAAFVLSSGHPLIALTLRYDRLDNFWFTLAQEIAHIALHLNAEENGEFFDNLDSEAVSVVEKEADLWAQEIIIPSKEWKISGLNRQSTPSQIKKFAQQLRISSAIVAGRIRKENHDYLLFPNLIGNREVRKLFYSKF